MRKKTLGQTATEYMALVAIIIGVFIGVGVYFKRGVQGRWKQAIDGVGDQYDPQRTNSDVVESTQGRSQSMVTAYPVAGGVWTMREDSSNMVETKTGASRVGAF